MFKIHYLAALGLSCLMACGPLLNLDWTQVLHWQEDSLSLGLTKEVQNSFKWDWELFRFSYCYTLFMERTFPVFPLLVEIFFSHLKFTSFWILKSSVFYVYKLMDIFVPVFWSWLISLMKCNMSVSKCRWSVEILACIPFCLLCYTSSDQSS